MLFMGPYIYLFMSLLSVFFYKDVNILGSNYAIIELNSSKKQKLALCQRQSGEPYYIDRKVLFKYFARSHLYNNLATDIKIL